MNQITKENILSAIEEIEKDGVRSGRHSSTYDLLYNGKLYPPKLVISIANRYATGEELDPKTFDGGLGTKSFQTLESFGFEIKPKEDPILSLLANYKVKIASTKMQDEVYKWELVKELKGLPDVNAPDFRAEIKKLNFQNLIYAMSGAVLQGLSKERPEELRALFKELFDESIDLKKRIVDFNQKTKTLYGTTDGKHSHHQDERSMACYLTIKYPEKYTFYKSSFYTSFCNLLGVKPAGKNEKYIHYLELLDKFINDYIAPDQELISLVKSYIPDFYDGTNNLLLAQDILYQMLESTEPVDYWIFQGNPKIYDIEGAIQSNSLTTWSVKAHESKIKSGDKVILWATGEKASCMALAEVTSDVFEGLVDEKELKYYTEKPETGPSKRVKIKITHNLVNSPISLDRIKSEPQLKSLKIGNQGTNFQATGKEYETILKMINDKSESQKKHNEDMKTEKFPLNQIMYGPPGTGKTYSTIDKVVSICAPESYNSNNHVANKIIYDDLIKEGRVVFTTFHQSVAYEDFIEGIKPVKPEEEDTFLKYDIEPGIFKQIANSAKKIQSSSKGSVDWDNVDYYKMSIGGKHNPELHDWCIENSVVGINWGGDEDLTPLISKSNSWKDFRDNFKTKFKETAEDNRYHIQAAFIFIKMRIGDIVVISKGNHIIDAIGKITGEYYFDDKSPKEFLHYRKVEWIAKNIDTFPDKFIGKQISQQSIYEFNTSDIKKEAFKEITSEHKTEAKPYAIVIDEINRGNISAVFGELITLIEEDKRIGENNELRLTLPYSKEKFGVPSNLYIIGTMNTADRSVEALDTALRRRFSFIEMMPKPEVLLDEGGNELEIEGTNYIINLPNLLKKLNERIEVLVDRDHTIGHAYFFNLNQLQDLRNTFHKNIIPLLQEYFYGNYEKMELVIGSKFFKKDERSKVIFAAKSNDFSFEGQAYTIRDASKMSDEDFTQAIKELMNVPKED